MVQKIRNLHRHTTLLVALITVMVIGLVWYALVAYGSDGYRVETVHIFPGSVQSDSWDRTDRVRHQNLDNYSLYQEFSTINAASPSGRSRTHEQTSTQDRTERTEDELDESSQTSGSATESSSDTTASDADQDSSSPESEAAQTESEDGVSDSATTSDTTADESIQETEAVQGTSTTDDEINSSSATTAESGNETFDAEPEESVDEPESEQATTSAARSLRNGIYFVANRARSLFPFASEQTETQSDASTTTNETPPPTEQQTPEEATTTPDASTTSDASGDVTDEDSQEVPEPDEETEPTVRGDAIDADTDVQTATTATTSTGTEDTDAPPEPEARDTDETTTATTSQQDATESETDVVESDPVADIDTEIITATEDGSRARCGEVKCQDYTMQLTDFGLPIFDEETLISGGQLRVSFAAKEKRYHRVEQNLSVRYSFDAGNTWQSGGSIQVVDEVSNSLNGGYYLFGLPDNLTAAMLDALVVELVYTGDMERMDDVYLDSAWLEVFTLTTPEDRDVTDISKTPADNGFREEPLAGDTLDTGDNVIEFDFTDDSTDESLMIKSSGRDYVGLSKARTYFNVTNTSDRADTFELQTHFPEGIGEVVSLQEWNRNKPRQIVVPEIRPFVYHCEAGWEATEQLSGRSLQDISREFTPAQILEQFGERIDLGQSEFEETRGEDVLESNTTAPAADTDEYDGATTSTTSAALPRAASYPFVQQQVTNKKREIAGREFVCRNTNVVQTCDKITGDNTACQVDDVKVNEHTMTYNQGGWERRDFSTGARPDPGLFSRFTQFLGFGPNMKDVPDTFEVRSHTDREYKIQPGETLYFKMDIEFPPFSAGEWWVEAIGSREYGLLDPFWQSNWEYRKTIELDGNTSGQILTEQQVLIELDASLSDFWSNVNEDGGDVRFAQQATSSTVTAPDFTELDYWMQNFDYEAQTASFWVQVPEIYHSTSTEIELYYGNELAETTSDQYAPFVHSELTDIYFVTKEDATGSIKVVSLVDDNQVQLNNETPVSLDAGESTTFTSYTAGSVVRSLGPVNSSIADEEVVEALSPIAFASTTFALPSIRGDEIVDVLAPFASANVDIFAGGSTTPELSFAITQGDVERRSDDWAGVDATILESDTPILLYTESVGAGTFANQGDETEIVTIDGTDFIEYRYTTTGADSFEVPTGIFEVEVLAIGGGGGGGNTANTGGFEAGGGGAGAFAQRTTNVTPGASISLQVGAGGPAEQATNSNRDSTFGSDPLVRAKGGTGGIGETPGIGGTTADSVGDLVYRGGNAARGGGGGAGTTGAGGDAAGTTGGLGTADFGGDGGDAPAATGPGNPGATYGGGGGGGTRTGGQPGVQTGGSGASGIVIIRHEISQTGDSLIAYPPTRDDLFGIKSQRTFLTTMANATNFTVRCSDTVNQSVTSLDRGVVHEEESCDDTADGQGPAVRISDQTASLTAIQQDDTSARESTAFWPEKEWANEYYLPDDSAYIAIACSPRFGTSSIEVLDMSGSVVNSGVCAPSGDFPGKLYFDGGNGPDTAAYFAGYSVRTTNQVPFYAIYENVAVAQNESNLFGLVQGRQFSFNTNVAAFGAQERNEEPFYDQTMYRWYENNDSLTPTQAWRLGANQTTLENEPITIGGAVFNNDILRLRIGLDNTQNDALVGSHAFRLQYAPAPVCTDVSSTEWNDVGAIASTTSAFRGFANSSVTDGSILSSLLLSLSTVVGTYQEENPSPTIQTEVLEDEVVEFDWVIENFAADPDTEYCFRMVRDNGQALAVYSELPQLVTGGPPLVPSLFTPFDNKHEAAVEPDFEFSAISSAGEDIHYQIQLATDFAFNDIVFDRNSDDNSSQFDNLINTADRSPFNSGQRIGFTQSSLLTDGETYWWRVRARDPDGSDLWSDWATAQSFTVNETIDLTEWYQTTSEQFATNQITNLATSSGGISLAAGETTGQLVSTPISFLDVDTGNAWGEFGWSDTQTDGIIRYQVEYNVGGGWTLIPESDLPGNITGFTGAPINLLGLNTDTYAQIRLVADFDGTDLSLEEWYVRAGERVGTPDLQAPFNHQKIATSAPQFRFVTTDPQGGDLEYELSVSSSADFTASTTYNSSSDTFVNLEDSGDTHPFNSGDTIGFTAPSTFTDGDTYFWRVRAKDPGGNDVFSPWSNPSAFTVDLTVDRSTWFQSIEDQFLQGSLENVEVTPTDTVTPTDKVGEYGTVNVTNGIWTTVTTELTYSEPIVVTSVRYDSTTEIQRVSRVRNKRSNSFEIRVANYDNSVTGSTVVDYMVMEAGDAFIIDGDGGTRVVADSVAVSAVAAEPLPIDPGGTTVDFSPGFVTQPSVLTTVTSNNDPGWVFSSTYDGTDRREPPTNTSLGLFLNRSFESAQHDEEMVDYIAIGQVRGSNNGTNFESLVGPSIVTGDPTEVDFSEAFGSAPQVALVQQASQRDDGGGYAVTTQNPSITAHTVAIDSDGPAADRTSDAENTAHIVFTEASGILIRDINPVSLLDFTEQGDNTFTTTVNGEPWVVHEFTAAGQDSFVPPEGLQEAQVWAIGAGGGGGNTANSGTSLAAGGGGGAFASSTITVNDLTTYNLVVGSGGLAEVDGDNSTFGSGPLLRAAGGTAGVGEVPGTGGTVGSSTADLLYRGGDADRGGGGGAGTTGAGGDANDTVGGTGTAEFGGDGGDAPTATNPGNPGVTHGGGGSGGTRTGGQPGSRFGGAGADGLVVIRYSLVDPEPPGALDLSGTFRSDPIDFSDGNSPKFEAFSWSDLTPGSSLARYQVEYQTSGGSWELVPDAVIPENSTGTTSTPINLDPLDTTFYNTLRLVTTMECDGSNCPELEDWTVTWSEGFDVSGTLREVDRQTAVTEGTVRVAVNGVLAPGTGVVNSSGQWTVSGVTAFEDDVVTVYVDTASSTNRAANVLVYDGSGNITGIDLYEQHLSFSSDQNSTVTNADVAAYDNNVSGIDAVFFAVTGDDLDVCAVSDCDNYNIYIGTESQFQPSTTESVTVDVPGDLVNRGTISLDTNTLLVGGSWDDASTINVDQSTVIFTASSGVQTLNNVFDLLTFHNVTFGDGVANATWQPQGSFTVTGDMSVQSGTLLRDLANSISITGDLSTGSAGFWSGFGTTTFTGANTRSWSDANSQPQNVGAVILSGSEKTIDVASDVRASSITIMSDNTFRGGSTNVIQVAGDWNNQGTFAAQTSEVQLLHIDGLTTSHSINTGNSNFFDLSTVDATTTVSFMEPTVTVGNDFTIAAGTVVLPSERLDIGGSFLNTGGGFAHNNGNVRFTATSGSNQIVQNVTGFLNEFYDLSFTGSGQWEFVDTNHVVRNTLTITNGTPTFPTGELLVADDMIVSGDGDFASNQGLVKLAGVSTSTVSANAVSFYDLTVATDGSSEVREFADSVVYVDRNFTIDEGIAILPPIFEVGGSFVNNADFNPQSGEVRMVGTDTDIHTITTNGIPLYDLLIDATQGTLNLSTDITVSNDFTVAQVNGLTLATTSTITIGNSFTNSTDGTSTNWDGTLQFLNSDDQTINAKSNAGDAYGIFDVQGSSTVSMWNSTVDNVLHGTSSAVYSQNNAGINGDLYIYGDYVRASGTEYWTHDVDFDGVSLAGTERSVRVRIASSSAVTIDGAALSIIGTSTASTSIDAISGNFTFALSTADLTSQYFTVTGTDTDGMQWLASTTVNQFTDGLFEVAPGGFSGISIDETTIDTNATAEFEHIDFTSTEPIDAFNITRLGSLPSSFVVFRSGAGNLYGEDFDDSDADPGAIRFDDSSITVAISGTVYADAGATPLSSPTCDGSTDVVRVEVDGGNFSDAVPCATDGTYSFGAVSFTGDPDILVYLDTDGGAHGTAVTRTPLVDITNMDIYQNRVIVRHESPQPMRIDRMNQFDNTDDSDVGFLVNGNELEVLPGNELYVFNNKTFTPGGEVTLTGDGQSNDYDGTLAIGENATFNTLATSTLTIGGRLVLDTDAAFDAASSTTRFTASTTGKSITSTSSVTFNDLTFAGAGGGWHLGTDITVLGDMQIDQGTVTGTGDITIATGSLGGDGTLSLGGGVTTLDSSNIVSGAAPWTFYDLQLGTGNTVGTTTLDRSATTTIANTLTVAMAHHLALGSSVLDLAGDNTVVTSVGSIDADTSTIRYSGLASDIAPLPYHNLLLDAGSSSGTYTAPSTGLLIGKDLSIGDSNPSTFEVTSNNPAVTIDGSVMIAANGTFEASNSALLTVGGDWTDHGTFTANGGTVQFSPDTEATINAGTAPFANVIIDTLGDVTVARHATATDSWILDDHDTFTVAGGQTLAVGDNFQNTLGGTSTVWASSTLRLFGGAYESNASSTSDVYDTLAVTNGAQIRSWNATAATYVVDAGASLYSQNHENNVGELYIFGDYINTEFADYWSYDRDWDGTDISGTPRLAQVFIAGDGSAVWSGGSLTALGDEVGTTTVNAFGGGTYDLEFTTGSTVNINRLQVRDTSASGIQFTGTPSVIDFSRTDHLLEIQDGYTMTVAGSAINANPSKNFIENSFNTASGLSDPLNVRATGTAVSAWRFTNHSGSIDGEDFDDDDGGDPGYIVWDDSTPVIGISGHVYESDGSTVSSVCDNSTENIYLAVDTVIPAEGTTSCDSSTGEFNFTDVNFSANDTLTVFIKDETPKAVNVSKQPISSINNMDLYESHVIVRHEDNSPLTISDMAVFDNSDDADILYTASTGNPDTLTLAANTKLLIWNNKTFAPDGEVTIPGGGSGDVTGGSLELADGATLQMAGDDLISIGGNLTTGNSAEFDVANTSELRFTSTTTGRTIGVNASELGTMTFTGSGSWALTDTTLTAGGDVIINAGMVTLPTGTSTIGASLDADGGAVDVQNAPLVFTGSDVGNVIRVGGDTIGSLTISGSGDWELVDTNVTVTENVLLTNGTLTMPSGTMDVGGNFDNQAGSIVHNDSELLMSGINNTFVRASSSDLFSLTVDSGDIVSLLDDEITWRGDVTVATGTLEAAATTTTIGGSLEAATGTLLTGSSTVLFNGSSLGHTINAPNTNFYDLQFSAPAGGYSLQSDIAVLRNLTLSAVADFSVATTTTISVGGVFTNDVGGGATDWTDSTLVLHGGLAYTINDKTTAAETYDALEISAGTHVRFWNSDVTSVTVGTSSSLYSKDHNNTNGLAHVYGDFAIGSSTEYWRFDRDFDGTDLSGGSERAVDVRIDNTATTTVFGDGSLQIIGDPTATTTIESQSGQYAFRVAGGTFIAEQYEFYDLDAKGLQLSGTPSIVDLSDGYFELAVASGRLITVDAQTVSNNPSRVFDRIGFADPGMLGGFNVELVGETTAAWRFRDGFGNLYGEDDDIDGTADCGSIRWNDSSCLLSQQSEVRWRNDDGGIGAPDNEWYDLDWGNRMQIRLDYPGPDNVTNAVVPIVLPHATDMDANFSDLRVTTADGQTVLPHWVERFATNDEALVWVEVPLLDTDQVTSIYVYYNNTSAVDTSDASAIFSFVEDFESGSLASYSGQTNLFAADTSLVFGGEYALVADPQDDRTDAGGIYRTDSTVAQGDMIRFRQYVDASSGANDEICTKFAVQVPGSANENYAVCIELFGTDRISIAQDVVENSDSGSVLASTPVDYTTGWYEVLVDWQTNGTIDVTLFDPNGDIATTTSAVDTTYSSGGIGFAHWLNYGAWDSYLVYDRYPVRPDVFIGGEQVSGGASWASNQNEPTSAFDVGERARLRVAVENRGLDLTDQQFRLEYAELGAASICSAVPLTSFAPVPNQSSCDGSPVCMATSTNISNDALIGDLLANTLGDYTTGRSVTDPTNRTVGLDLDQNFYTELEYAITPTNQAEDTLCFIVSNDGERLDFYETIAELQFEFEPFVSTIDFNNGDDISLLPGVTTPIVATSTVGDFNGFTDITTATTTFFRSGVAGGAACSPDDNNCYVTSTADNSCELINCADNSCDLICTADMWFHADPTDNVSQFDGEEWFAFVEVEDFSDGYGFDTSAGEQNLITLNALDVESAIDYEDLFPGEDTGSFNPVTPIVNIGNVALLPEVEGIDMSDGLSSTIPASQQRFATSTFEYSTCTICSSLTSGDSVEIGTDINKPTAPAPPETIDVFWGIEVPPQTVSNPHQGANIFWAVYENP